MRIELETDSNVTRMTINGHEVGEVVRLNLETRPRRHAVIMVLADPDGDAGKALLRAEAEDWLKVRILDPKELWSRAKEFTDWPNDDIKDWESIHGPLIDFVPDEKSKDYTPIELRNFFGVPLSWFEGRSALTHYRLGEKLARVGFRPWTLNKDEDPWDQVQRMPYKERAKLLFNSMRRYRNYLARKPAKGAR